MMGIPDRWAVVETWMDNSVVPEYPFSEPQPAQERSFPDIPILEDYTVMPPDVFWKKFPQRGLPTRAETRINARNLERLVEKHKENLSVTELNRAHRVIRDLRQGAESYQKSSLPPITVQNTKSAIEHGALMTDKIATWIRDGYVAGPFDSPPMPGFRANPLMAVVRNGKVRPVLNMSGPKGQSFNDNVDTGKLEKVHMNTAKEFGYLLKESGKEAKFSKFDYKDAYKTIPSKATDFRLQGFKWLGKYFCETQQTFGGIPSVCNFDREGNILQVLAIVESSIPRNYTLRILDDTSNIGPKNTLYAEKFACAMRTICSYVNMPLAPLCPNREKAFEVQTRGTVMGIGFNSKDMSWFLPKDKADRTISRCLEIYNSSQIGLKQLEKAMGSINDLAQMAQFAKFYKHSGNTLLRAFNGNYDILKQVTPSLQRDMLVLAKIAETARVALPIMSRPSDGPLTTLTFYSDAAGASFAMVEGQRVFHSNDSKGVACIGGLDKDDIWVWTRLEWPEGFLTKTRDDTGKFYGSKSTTLECIGLLLPFISFPEAVCGRFVKFLIDNSAVAYGWRKGYVKFDSSASEILRATNMLASYLGVKVYVEHVPRMSDDLATLADKLSRNRHHSRAPEYLLKKPGSRIMSWLSSPTTDGKLATDLLKELKEAFPM